MNIQIIFIIVMLLNACSQVVVAQTLPKDQVARRGFFERGKINGSFGYVTGRLSDFVKGADGQLDFSQPVTRVRSTLAFNVGVNLFERVYFRTTLYYNLNQKINAPWLTQDYSYILERAKWDPNSFSYGYTNYEINKYSDNMETFLNNLSKGFFYGRYYNRIPNSWMGPLKLDSTASISFSIIMKYAFRYQNSNGVMEGDISHGKPVASFTLRYVFLKNIYIEGAAFSYLRPETQLHFDPDFTYGFGYNSYTHLSLGFSYGNYSENRFPWREKKVKDYGFLDGQFSIMLNYSW